MVHFYLCDSCERLLGWWGGAYEIYIYIYIFWIGGTQSALFFVCLLLWLVLLLRMMLKGLVLVLLVALVSANAGWYHCRNEGDSNDCCLGMEKILLFSFSLLSSLSFLLLFSLHPPLSSSHYPPSPLSLPPPLFFTFPPYQVILGEGMCVLVPEINGLLLRLKMPVFNVVRRCLGTLLLVCLYIIVCL